MKALVYIAPYHLEYREAPDPSVSEDEWLVKVDSVGICGSDMHAYLGHDERRPPPLILGHEAAGVIAQGERAGERVTINPLVNCGTCAACRGGWENLCPQRKIMSMPPLEGAFAQFIAVPSSNLVTVPSHVSLEQASLVEPIACSWHAVRLGLRALEGRWAADCALIIGGGAIGVGAAICLAAHGVESVVISEPNAVRRRFLASLSAKVVPPEQAADNTSQGGGYPLVIDAVGFAASRATACALTRAGGVIVHIGLGAGEGGVDARRMTLQEITFIGSYTYTPRDFKAAAAAAFAGKLGALSWFETRPLSAGGKAFSDIRAGKTPAPKIVLKP